MQCAPWTAVTESEIFQQKHEFCSCVSLSNRQFVQTAAQVGRIVPAEHLPTAGVVGNPVERSVAQFEVARKVQRHAGHVPAGGIKYAAVHDQQDLLPGVASRQRLQRGGNPRIALAQAFAVRRDEVRLSARDARLQVGEEVLRLLPRMPLKHTEIPLAQCADGYHLLPAWFCDRLRRMHGTLQVGAVDGVEIGLCERQTQRARLFLPGGIQGNVFVTLQAAFDIPVGFTMPDEAHSGVKGRHVENTEQAPARKGRKYTSLTARSLRKFPQRAQCQYSLRPESQA